MLGVDVGVDNNVEHWRWNYISDGLIPHGTRKLDASRLRGCGFDFRAFVNGQSSSLSSEKFQVEQPSNI
jgi:hypothetical protein